MDYIIYNKGNEINTISCDEEFVVAYCEANGYSYKPQNSGEPTESERLRADIDYLSALLGEALSVFEIAVKYYPRLWPIERLYTLCEAGKLTQGEIERLVQ